LIDERFEGEEKVPVCEFLEAEQSQGLQQSAIAADDLQSLITHIHTLEPEHLQL
jgi:hypothetical protein